MTVTVSDGKASASASQAIDLVKPNAAPSAAFTAAASGLSLALDASASSDPDGDALTYTWAFGDGAAGTGLAASHTYATAGTFTVSLVVSDGQASATTAKAVTVVQPNRAPLAAFTASTSSLKATVDASGSSDPDGNALTYAWSFGDGSSATGKTASHTYARAGTYTVVLKVSDGTLSAQASRTVTVQAFTATFAPKAVGNNWWVETAVTANQAIAKVEARINGGAWVQLPKDSWGTYAKSLNAPDGSHVVFRATNASGASVTSATYTWT